MCFSFEFNSEDVLCHARLPAALNVIHMPRDGGGWWVYAYGVAGGVRVQGCEGARLQGCEGVRLQGCEGVRVQGCEGVRVSNVLYTLYNLLFVMQYRDSKTLY